jgi:putative methyltransferase
MKGNRQERRVYFNEFNLLQGGSTYLPLVSGTLQAYVQKRSRNLGEGYRFMPFLFYIERFDTILTKYENPHIAAFSMVMWNENLCLSVARAVKERWPSCLIIFGGAQVPHHPIDFMKTYFFIDVAVRAEGEETFAELLERYLESHDFHDIIGATWRAPDGEIIVNPGERPFERGLDIYPSPYLEGLYDNLMREYSEFQFQAILETNRGCPFKCTFCYWGKGGLSRKFRYHSLDRVAQEIDWCGKNRIGYIFSADSNFGMHRRDKEIALLLAETKRKYGFPEKFRACYGKNTDDKIFEVASILHAGRLDKGVSLSRQSNNQQVQANIKRGNIKIDSYRNLQKRFNDVDIPTWTELIIGLPGETFDTLSAGIEELLNSGLKNLYLYFLEVYPNTEMADPEYQERFGIRTVKSELQEIHSNLREPGIVPEHLDLVVETATMEEAVWKRSWCLAWTVMLFHGLKVAYYIMSYLRNRHGVRFIDFLQFISEERMSPATGGMMRSETVRWREVLAVMIKGAGRGAVMPEHGDIYWQQEEASFFRLAEDWDRFYDEMHSILRELLKSRNIAHDDEELSEVLRYQRMRMPSPEPPMITAWQFAFNVPEYFERAEAGEPIPLRRISQTMEVLVSDYRGDRKRFAIEGLLWSRKDDAILNPATWHLSENRNP